MKDEKKTKAQLIDELAGLRQRISRLDDREGDPKKAEEILREGEGKEENSRAQEQLQTIVEAIPIPLLITRDRDGQILYANEHLGHLFGVPTDSLLGRKALDFYFDPDERDKILETFIRDGYLHNREIRGKRTDGTPFWVYVSVQSITFNGETALLTCFNDVTGLKQAGEFLRESEERFRAVFESSPIGTAMVDTDGRFVQVNRAFKDMLGYPGDDFLNMNFTEITHPDDIPQSLRLVKQLLEGTRDHGWLEKRYLHREGHFVWSHTGVSALHNPEGKVQYLIALTQDITERKRSEEELQFKNIILSTQLETSIDGILVVDADKKWASFNKRFLAMWGYPPESAGTMTSELALQVVLDKLVDPEGFLEQINYLYEHRHEKSHDNIQLRNGCTFERYSAPMFGPGEKYYGRVWYYRDITRRKQAEDEMVRLERLRALGEMARGVAHNFNNILVGVLGYAQLIQMRSHDPEITQYATSVVESAMRARDLVHRLNQAVRGEVDGDIKAVHINEVVREAVEASRPRWEDESQAKGITINLVSDLDEVPPIRATQSGLYDILINLLLNAVDSLTEGGSITIRTRSVGERVELTVSDTGIGMEEKMRSRVFEPFFTTKMNVGTGLGLSTVYGTVTRYGGQIDIASSPGKGTTFTLLFPIWMELEDTEGKAPQRILIVEDKEVVADVLSNLLSKNSEVDTILDGTEALKTFAPGRYDVALIDLGLPGTPGDQVARKMKNLDPSIATILITGWELSDEDPRLSAFDFRLKKPFNELKKVEDAVAKAFKLHQSRIAGKD